VPGVVFRVRARDASARLGEIRTKSGTLETPVFFPVFNPNKPYLSPMEMSEIGAQTVMTNAYIIYRTPRLRERALEEGIHSLLGFEGVVATDSGAYQIYRYGDIEVTNLEIVRFQHEIGSDIGSIVDVPMADDIAREAAERGVEVTLRHAREWSEVRDSLRGTLWIGTPQGSVYGDLVERASREMASLDFDYYGVGSIKKSLESYDYATQVDHFLTVRRLIPRGKPVHFWGIGHPSTFALFAAMGADSFDSAAYALFAEDGRYMTPLGTMELSDIEEFPCSCPVCRSYTPRELMSAPRSERVRALAAHNLHVSIQEMRLVREAIRGGWLWELVQERVRAHPRLLEALLRLLERYGDYLEENEPFSKRSGLFYSGPETAMRPEVRRAVRLLKRVERGRTYEDPLFGPVPLGLRYTYPFGHAMIPGFREPPEDPTDREIVEAVLSYQFGPEALSVLEGRELVVSRSKRTGMPRDILIDGERFGFLRPYDGLVVLSLEGARRLLECLPRPSSRVVVHDRYAETVARGTSVFVRFVREVDPAVRPGSEVIIVDGSDNLLATGRAVLSAAEVPEFPAGHVFAKVRHHVLPRQNPSTMDWST